MLSYPPSMITSLRKGEKEKILYSCPSLGQSWTPTRHSSWGDTSRLAIAYGHQMNAMTEHTFSDSREALPRPRLGVAQRFLTQSVLLALTDMPL